MVRHNVIEYGAAGNGTASDTAAIQKALDQGGEIFFPAGRYMCGTLYLRSDSALVLEKGAEIVADLENGIFNAPDFIPQNRVSIKEKTNGRHLLVAVGERNISITGGVFNGQALEFYLSHGAEDGFVFERQEHNSQMIFICECENITLKDTVFQNSPYWHCLLHGCVNVLAERVTITGDPRVLNNDGFDIDCCENVIIRDCDIETGDDCIAIRGNDAPLVNKRACAGVYVSDCRLRCNFASGVRVGVGSGVIRDCRIERVTITGETGITLCTGWWTPHYVTIRDIVFKDIEMKVKRLCRMMHNSTCGAESGEDPLIKNIFFNNIKAQASLNVKIDGGDPCRMENICFSGLQLDIDGPGTAPENDAQGRWGVDSEDCAVKVNNVRNASFEDVQVSFNDDGDWKCDLRVSGNEKVHVKNWEFTKGVEY